MKKNILLVLIILLSLICIYSGTRIILYFVDKSNTEELQTITNEYVVIDKVEDGEEEKEEVIIDFDSLSKKNSDVVGYLKVNNTNIDYVVVKTKNNNYYLNHNFNKKWSSSGWIFADYRNKIDGSDKNIVIYGHSMKSGSMFGTLRKALKKDWYKNKDNRKIMFATKDGTSYYEIFSIYSIMSEDYYINTKFENDDSFKEFIKTIKNRSIYNFKVDVSETDSILTLSTCYNTNNKRIVVHAKKISE